LYLIKYFNKIGMVKAESIIKISLVGIGAYLAYDYWKKKKSNEAIEIGSMESSEKVAPMIVDAEIQEDGEEGLAEEYQYDSDINSNNHLMGDFDGWDSDTISNGIA
jgi:hypothetical protein